MNNETWRPCAAAPNYEVSDMGRVRRAAPGRKTFAGRVMKQQQTAGYMSVRPTVNGKNVCMYVHDLVAAAFLGAKPVDAIVNHIDTVKTNNKRGNLEYTTHAGNMRHAADTGLMVHGSAHPQSKLTEEAVIRLRADRAAGMSFSRLARAYGVSIATAFNAAKGNNWRRV